MFESGFEVMAGAGAAEAQAPQLRKALLAWFDQYKRDLPWRRTRDPYAIWVSEIMLQQTRVAAVLEHYERWMERFPTVGALAQADEPEVLALWSGLGYYRRARFLHAGARSVVQEYAGQLPQTASALRALPGIGEYTSAAIASIAFGEPVAVVDGNVERVVLRIAGLSLEQPGVVDSGDRIDDAGAAKARKIGPGHTVAGSLRAAPLAREIRSIAASLLDADRPGDFNQAMMELGATICLPRGPLCLQCPAHPWCATRGEHASAPRKAMLRREVTYALVERVSGSDRQVLLAQRPAHASLMPGMWDLPEVSASSQPSTLLLTLRHAITVTNYTVRIVAYPEQQATAFLAKETTRWIALARLPEIALTGLARKTLKRLSLWPLPAVPL